MVSATVVTITAKESDGIARSGEYIKRGIPLPIDSGCTSISNMKITTDSGGNSPIDAQFHIISRWDTNGNGADSSDPVRVVLVIFKAAVSSNATSTYFLHTTGGSGNAAGSNIATDNTGDVSLDTGTMAVRLKKTAGFNFFDRVTVDGVDLVSSPASDGIIARYSGVDYTSYNSNATPTVTIHYNGPLMACVSVAGDLQSSNHALLVPPNGVNGVKYKAFFWVYKGERVVRPTVTIKNENTGYAGGSDYAHIATLPLDNLYIRTSLGGLGTPTAVRFGAGEASGAAYSKTSPSGVYVVDQDHPDWANDHTTQDDFSAMSYKVGVSGSEANHTADRFNSYAQMRDASRGLMVASRWFWQEYWKRIEVDATNKRIDFYLWPHKSFTHPFVGGIWKSHELLYDFHGNVSSDYTFSEELAAVKKRVRGYLSTEFTSEYFYRIADLGVDPHVIYNNNPGENVRAAIANYEKELLSRFDGSVSTYVDRVSDWNSLRRNRPLTWNFGIYKGNYMNWYGWMNFGDGARSGDDGYGAQNYDWIWTANAAGLQNKRNDILETADQLALHYGDILIIHNPTNSMTNASSGTYQADIHGSQRPEGDGLGHGGNFLYRLQGTGGMNEPADLGHTWASGYLWTYLMYGDPLVQDAADHIADHVVYRISNVPRHATQTDSDKTCNVGRCYANLIETRQYSRAFPILVDLWKIKGDYQYLSLAANVFTNGLIPNEYGYGSTPLGFINNRQSPEDSWVGYDCFLPIDLIQVWRALNEAGENTVKPTIQSFLTREAVWVRDKLFTKWPNGTGGSYLNGKYFAYQVPQGYYVNPATPSTGTDDGSYTHAFTQGFAFLYERTGLQSWLDLARVAWRDGWAYGVPIGDLRHDYENIQTDPLLVTAEFATPQPAWMKYAKQTQAAMYYVAVEFKKTSQQSSGGGKPNIRSITNSSSGN